MDTQPNIFERYDADKLCEQVRRHPGAPHLTKKYNLEDIELLRTDIRLFIRDFINEKWCASQRKITSVIAVRYMAWLKTVIYSDIKANTPEWIWRDFEDYLAFESSKVPANGSSEMLTGKASTLEGVQIHETLIDKATRVHKIMGIDCGYSGGDFSTVIYDDELDACNYARAAVSHFSHLHQENNMSHMNAKANFFKKQVLINDKPADELSDEEIIDSIHSAQATIAYLKGIETSSKKITKRIEKLTKQIGQVAAYLDAR